MQQGKTVKCRFCDYEVLRFRALKGGKKLGPDVAYETLLDHIEREHPSEFPAIITVIDEIQEEAYQRELLPTFTY